MSTQYTFTQNFEYLEYMTCTEDFLLITQFLDKLKKNKIYFKLQPHELIQLVSQIIEKNVWQDKVFNHILFYYNTLRDL